MKKNLFLHIGFPKTGTSSIQYFFSQNRKALNTLGILYPLSGNTPYAGQAGLAFAARMKALNPFKILIDEIQRSPCKTIVLSSEYFFMLEANKIKFIAEQLSDFKVTVIVYLRRQDARIESGYLQVLRDTDFRFSGSIEDYISFLRTHPRRTDYYKFLQPWSDIFGLSAIRVCVYEEHSGGDRLVPGFLKIINCPLTQDLGINNKKQNVAYKPILNRILRRINFLPLPKKVHILILSLFDLLTRHVFGSGSIAEHNLLSKAERKAIIEEYQESNRNVAMQYLGRDNGQLFHEDGPNENRP